MDLEERSKGRIGKATATVIGLVIVGTGCTVISLSRNEGPVNVAVPQTVRDVMSVPDVGALVGESAAVVGPTSQPSKMPTRDGA